MMKNAKYLKVCAQPRYWEDACLDGEELAENGSFPFRDGNRWTPVIDIEEGRIIDWPEGKTAFVHFKVCDQGDYLLVDGDGNVVGKYRSDYVPDVMCPADNGYGDYIIMDIAEDGSISDWCIDDINDEDWPEPPK